MVLHDALSLTWKGELSKVGEAARQAVGNSQAESCGSQLQTLPGPQKAGGTLPNPFSSRMAHWQQRNRLVDGVQDLGSCDIISLLSHSLDLGTARFRVMETG